MEVIFLNLKKNTINLYDQKLLNWAADLSQKQAFQNLVDAVAGYHITIGEWPPQNEMVDALQTYSAIPNYGRDGSGDSDGDNVANDCDLCIGNDATGDTDSDGICNNQDNDDDNNTTSQTRTST